MSQSPHAAQRAGAVDGGNPALRMMGLPRMRAKLPSRNWMIFLTVTGSFTAAVMYDRYHVKKIQERWCRRVSHLADQPLNTQELPRRITVFLEAPPGDYLLSAREYFRDYVKPILVSAAVDWDLVEGRREGDIRHRLASNIRQRRKHLGESPSDSRDRKIEEDAVVSMRAKSGIHNSSERGGDLIIGRHTWKEYVRGIHEGWLGPLESPISETHLASIAPADGGPDSAHDSSATNETTPSHQNDEVTFNTSSTNLLKDGKVGSIDSPVLEDIVSNPSDEKQKAEDQSTNDSANPTPKAASHTVERGGTPFIRPSQYPTCTLSPSTPDSFDPSLPIGFPHLLGFLNTPVRIWRFLNKRRVAEETSAAVSAFLLSGNHSIRSFHGENSVQAAGSSHSKAYNQQKSSEMSLGDEAACEWQTILEHEEMDWHKSARAPNSDNESSRERPWQEPIVVDRRLGERMRIIDVEDFLIMTASPRQGQLSGPGSDADVLSEIPEAQGVQKDQAPFHSVDWKGGVTPKPHLSLLQRVQKWYSGAPTSDFS